MKSAYINPEFKKAQLEVTHMQKFCAQELQELHQSIVDGVIPHSQEFIHNSFLETARNLEKTQDDLLGVGHMRIIREANRLAKLVQQDARITISEKVKMLLALGALTQDVSHVLGAIALLGEDFRKDVESWKVTEDMNDFSIKS